MPITMSVEDLATRYRVAGHGGVAFRLLGWVVEVAPIVDELGCEDEECDHDGAECWFASEPEEVESDSMVRVVMVGDDREWQVDADDLSPLAEEEFCAGCGQVGCGHDGRDVEPMSALEQLRWL